MWAEVRCWLIRKKDKKAFLKKIEDIEFWGHGCDIPRLDQQWLGEYPWVDSVKEDDEHFRLREDWLGEVSVDIMQTVFGYSDERSGIYPRLPSPTVCKLLNLTWDGKNFDYVNSAGDILAFSPSEKKYDDEQSWPLLVKREAFLDAIEQKGLVAIWAVLSERGCYSHQSEKSIVNTWAITQRVYGFGKGSLEKYCEMQYEIPLYS